MAKDEGSTSGVRSVGIDLAVLNRHWYRRSLDVLDRVLRESPPDPSQEDQRVLIQRVVTAFLAAVTGQAPDSSQLQFPADRAYFIPFEGDKSGRFDFAKAFYRLASGLDQINAARRAGLEDSVWSFLPLSRESEPQIDQKRSTEVTAEGEHRTIGLEDLVSVRNIFRGSESRTGGGMFFEKGLLLQKDVEEDLLEEFFRLNWISSDVAVREKAKARLLGACGRAVLAIHDILQAEPGNAAVEAVLQQHVVVLRWMLKAIENRPDSISTTSEGDLSRLFIVLSEAKRLRADGTIDANEAGSPKSEGKPAAPTDDPHPDPSVDELGDTLMEALASYTEESVTTLRESDPELATFQDVLLGLGAEERIQQDLRAALESETPIAGELGQSYVWVVPDYRDLSGSLPARLSLRGGKGSAESATSEDAQSEASQGPSGSSPSEDAARKITEAYRLFCSWFDELLLSSGSRDTLLKAYWRAKGQAGRKELVFGDGREALVSGDGPRNLKARSALGDPGWGVDADLWHEKRPQSYFLRVRIADSRNEPVINGLFVFTRDFDELAHEVKEPEQAKQDRDDLLAFAKVYFFAVRDFIRGIDRSLDARNIGELNQHLFDRRLRILDREMESWASSLEGGGGLRVGWPVFRYGLLNNYAASLIEKPPEIGTETFPFDRVLVIPLDSRAADESGGVDDGFDLPFYLFQTLYAERQDGELRHQLYSLVKPYQSPLERLEVASHRDRFGSKTFQSAPRRGDSAESIDRYLAKEYIGSLEADGSAGSLSSHVVKAVSKGGATGAGGAPMDRGAEWAGRAIDGFLKESLPKNTAEAKADGGGWRSFLNGITRDLAAMNTQGSEVNGHWLVFRLGLLRLLRTQAEHRPGRVAHTRFGFVAEQYALDHSLKFEGHDSVHVLNRAESEFDGLWAELVAAFPELAGTREAAEAAIPFSSLYYSPSSKTVSASGEDVVLGFLEHLTRCVANVSSACTTWYQPSLTRPMSEGKAAATLEEHRRAGAWIGDRGPQYAAISAGKDSIASFLGVVNLGVGEGLRRLNLRCLVAVLRDFDDRQTIGGLTKLEVERQLEEDLRDLSLFTTTFFRNAGRFCEDALKGEEVEVLSRDITQIARNWYSSGMDEVSRKLGVRLNRLLRDREDARIGELRRVILTEFVESVLWELVKPQAEPETGREIKLESFPFDRMLHIPLHGLGEGASASHPVSYVLTRIHNPTNGEVWDYGTIRKKGRAWAREGYVKEAAFDTRHLGLDRSAWDGSEFSEFVRALGNPRVIDALTRSMYEAHALQTVVLSGILIHAMDSLLHVKDDAEAPRRPAKEEDDAEAPRGRAREDAAAALGSARERLSRALRDSVRATEQARGGGEGEAPVFTAVHMDPEVTLPPMPDELLEEEESLLVDFVGDVKRLPGVREFLGLAGHGDHTYGLEVDGGAATSKIFYVYYSLEAPRGFSRVPPEGRYMGVFAFIVDDASTDVKDDLAAHADQQDIRTFVHNCVRALGATLELQSLENRIRKPGAAGFVTGIMHRLKNDLSEPMGLLDRMSDDLGRARRSSEGSEDQLKLMEEDGGLAASRADLLQKLHGDAVRAHESIDGIKTLFVIMKRVADLREEFVPLQTFTTDWLAWKWACCLAEMLPKQLSNLNSEVPDEELEHQFAAIKKDAEAGLAKASRSYEAGTSSTQALRASASVGRTLMRLESAVAESLEGRGYEVKLVLEYRSALFDRREFFGSFLLDEAVNLLFGNAVEAFATAIEDGVAGDGAYVLALSVGPGAEGEFDVEVLNTSRRVPQDILSVANAEPPRVITKQRHAKGSGKAGGSGFGHYFARNIVRGFCGGPEHRRSLDISLDYRPDDGAAVVRMNLIDVSSHGVAVVDAEELTRVFDERIDREMSDALPKGEAYALPGWVKPSWLPEIARRIVEEDRGHLLKRVSDVFEYDLQEIGMRCRDLVEELEQVLTERVGSRKTGQGRYGDEEDLLRRLNSGAFDPASPRELRKTCALVAEVPGLREELVSEGEFWPDDDTWFSGHGPENIQLVDLDEMKKRWSPYLRLLRTGLVTNGAVDCAAILDSSSEDAAGRLCATPADIKKILVEPQWFVENRRDGQGRRVVDVALVDRSSENGQRLDVGPTRQSRLGHSKWTASFHSYRQAMRSLSESEEGRGDLRFVRTDLGDDWVSSRAVEILFPLQH